MWPNLMAFCILVIGVLVIHLVVLTADQKCKFRLLAKACKRDEDLIPIAFILGFYVEIVVTRWWAQYVRMPWPDQMAMYISTLLYGEDDRGRMIRRTVIRYCNLALVLTLRLFSTRIQRRFPTYDHLQEAGLLQGNEKFIMENIDRQTKHPKYWMPLVWAAGIVVRARKEGRVRDDYSMKTLVDGLNTFRGQCGGMIDYDWICIPLVYTQVVTLAVYLFIVTAVIGSQAPTQKDSEFEIYFPVFSFIKLFFYMGWLKVAESLVNPWGDDDDDFEVNWMVDRHLQVSYMIVDEMHQEHPEMLKDQYWDDVYPIELPYTQASRQFNSPPSQSSHLGLISSEARRAMSYRSRDMGEQEDELDSGSDGDGDGEDTSSRREESPPESSTSIRPTFYRQLRRGERGAKLNRSDSTQLLYETETSSFSSLLELSRTQSEEEMFQMSDISISYRRTKSEEEEIPLFTTENTEESTESDQDSRIYALHKAREMVTDLRPVDLSLPDDEPQPYSVDDWSATGLHDSAPVRHPMDDYSSDTSPAEQLGPNVKVIVPTGEPVQHTFSPDLTPVSSDSSETEKQMTPPQGILKEDSPEESMIDKHVSFNLQNNEEEQASILPPSMEVHETESFANISLAPSYIDGAVSRRSTIVLPEEETLASTSHTDKSPEWVEPTENPPSHTVTFDPALDERDTMEAARAARRGFHELEPISEQVESPQDKDKPDESPQDESPQDESPQDESPQDEPNTTSQHTNQGKQNKGGSSSQTQ